MYGVPALPWPAVSFSILLLESFIIDRRFLLHCTCCLCWNVLEFSGSVLDNHYFLPVPIIGINISFVFFFFFLLLLISFCRLGDARDVQWFRGSLTSCWLHNHWFELERIGLSIWCTVGIRELPCIIDLYSGISCHMLTQLFTKIYVICSIK